MRILTTLLLVFSALFAMADGKRETKRVQVGETFTLNCSGHSKLDNVSWNWDIGGLELSGNLYPTSTSATFRAKKQNSVTPYIVRATVYYLDGKGHRAHFYDEWKVFVEDNTTVRLSQNDKNLKEGESFALNASPTPSTYNGKYTWESTRPSVVGVSGNGSSVTVKAYSPGQATIRVTLDNGKYADCNVKVEDNATVAMNNSRYEAYTGSTFTLQAYTTPSYYSGSFYWDSSNKAVATCSGRGSSATITACGEGKTTVYVTLGNGARAECDVYVKDVDVTNVRISDMSVEVEKSITPKADISPYNATVKRTEWIVDEGKDILRSSEGILTGLKPGTAKVYCQVNGNVRSNLATVEVTEPPLTFSIGIPVNASIGISPFTNPTVTYSHSIREGAGLNQVRLYSADGNVKGSISISDRKLIFIPDSPLKPLTEYSFSIPRKAVTNKWGSNPTSDVLISFTTSDYEKITLRPSPSSESFLTKADRITFEVVPSDAVIYFTLDGSEPTLSSQSYTKPIAISEDVTLKAFAVREGYYDSDTAAALYYKSQSEVEWYQPNDIEPFFNYNWLAPHLKLSGSVEKSNNFQRISLKMKDGTNVPGQACLTNDMIVYVPDELLENGKTYTMDIPRDAVKTSRGEVFRGFSWTFTTPAKTKEIAMQGDESVYLLSENGRLSTRGMEYLQTNISDGSYSYKDHDALTAMATDVDDIACGYTHRLIRKGTALSGSGFAYCGETATASSLKKIANARMIKAGFQTSAIIDADNSLWMAGRNDFYQLGDSTGSVAKELVNVADNVLDVALGNGYTLFVDTDNILWVVGRNHRGQLGDGTTVDRRMPVMIMEDVEKVFASTNGYFSGCLTTDHRLLTWGDNSNRQLGRYAEGFSSTPEKVLDNVESVSLGETHGLAVTDKCELHAWGANSHGQIPFAKGNMDSPTLVANNIRTVAAGPHTSLLLGLSGKVEGWGLRTHSNFGAGDGNAYGFVVDEGLELSALDSVTVYPSRFEAKPNEEFALAALPMPNSADYESVEWASANPDIVSVEGNGIVHTHNLGETVVTVSFTDRFGLRKEAVATIKCTDTPDNTYVSSIYDGSSDWTVRTQGMNIIIENTEPGAVFTLINVQGIQVKRLVSEGTRLTIPVGSTEPYIVKSGAKAVKVICL